MGQGSGAQGTSRGFNQLKEGHEAVRVTLPLRDFRKNAESLTCGLTTEWILESAQSLACALIKRTFYALERRTTHSSEWEGTQTLRRERQAHRWPFGWGEQCWLDQQGERPITELWGVKLTEGTISTDLLVAYTPFFFFFFLDPTYMGQGSRAQGTSRGFNQLKEGHEAVRVTLPLRDF